MDSELIKSQPKVIAKSMERIISLTLDKIEFKDSFQFLAESLDRLVSIQAPTLVMHNGLDFITAPRLTMPVEQNIPGAEGYWMRNAAHVVKLVN